MSNFVDSVLRQEVKQYINLKANINSKIILKENFIFGISKKASRLYIQKVVDQKFTILNDDLFVNKEIIAPIKIVNRYLGEVSYDITPVLYPPISKALGWLRSYS